MQQIASAVVTISKARASDGTSCTELFLLINDDDDDDDNDDDDEEVSKNCHVMHNI